MIEIGINASTKAVLYEDQDIELTNAFHEFSLIVSHEELEEFVAHWFATLTHDQRLLLLGKMVASAQCCFPVDQEDVIQDK